MKRLPAMPKVKRINPGFYSVGDNWYVETNDSDRPGAKKWIVRRFKPNSDILDQEYGFDSYAEARDHALMEASVTWLSKTFDADDSN